MAFISWRWLTLVALLFLGTLAVANNGTGRIEGKVTHQGKPVGGVVVIVHETGTTDVTTRTVEFAFDLVPAGSVTLILSQGDNTKTVAVVVTEGGTQQVEVEIDWDPGLLEEVRVTAAARAAKIVDAPSAVTSIPAAEIKTQASHGQVPKILEFTPGAEVTQSGLYDFNFNTRGFNSSLNRRVSTYIDGRDVGVVLLGAQEWAAISGGLDDLASLDFIRGPSAALYGANASSGVVNITTKAPRDTLGSFMRLTAGELRTRSVDFRRADNLGGGWYSKILAGTKNTGDFSISRNPDGPDGIARTADDLAAPEYSEFCMLIGETDCLPREKTLFREQDNDVQYGALRLDKYFGDDSVMTFEGGIVDIEGPAFQTGIGRVQGLNAKRPFYRFNYSNPRWNVLAHYSAREGDQVNLTKALIVNFDLDTDTKRYGVELQGNWNFGGDRGRFVIGAAHTEERVDTANKETGLQTVVLEPISTDRQAVFSQLDWRWNKHIKLVFAGRVDENTLHATQFSPKAALVYSITPKNSLRFTYNQAFQVANYSEFFLHTRISAFPIGGFVRVICGSPALPAPVDCGISENFVPILAVGNDDLRLEKTKAWEVGYTGLLANKVLITVDYYNSDNQDFITDLVPQVGTIPGIVEGCLNSRLQPETDPLKCPVNPDYLTWVGPEVAETTTLFGNVTVAQALRNAVDNSVGGTTLGFRLAQDLNGDTVVIARTYTNVGQVDTQGVDFGLQYFITPALNLQVSYSWFDFEIIDSDEEVRDILLPNSPEHKASLALSYSKNRWSAGLGGRWVENFRWSAGVFQGHVDDYYTVDLSAGYKISDLVRVGLNVANVTDNVHRQTFGGDLLRRRALANVTFTW